MPNSSPRPRWAVLLAAALPAAALVAGLQYYTRTLALSWWQCGLLWLLCTGLLTGAPRATRRQWGCLAVLGVLLAAALVADHTVYNPTTGLPAPWGIRLLLPFAFFALLLTAILAGLAVWVERLPAAHAAPPPRWAWPLYTVLLALGWLPWALTRAPLVITADSPQVLEQALGQAPLHDMQPILYTLLVRVFLRLGQALGSLRLGAGLLAAVQGLLLAACLAYSIVWLRRHGCPRWGAGLAIVYFVATPVFALNAVTLLKDMPFNACLLLLCLALWDALCPGAPPLRGVQVAKLAALCVVLCFLRGNGLLVAGCSALVLGLALRGQRARLLGVFLPLLLGVWLITGPLYGALGVRNLGSVESAAIPIQQVARSLANGAQLTEAQTARLAVICPADAMAAYYTYGSVDTVKNSAAFSREAFNESAGDFFALWAELAPTNKQNYLNAWLLATLGYWKLDFSTEWTYFLNEDYGGELASRDIWAQATGSPSLHDWALTHSQFIPLSVLFYLCLLTALLLCARRRARLALALTPAFLLWLGMMLGAPTYCEFRYLMLCALILPCALFWAAQGGKAPQSLDEKEASHGIN